MEAGIGDMCTCTHRDARTLDELEMVGDLLQDGEAGQDEAVRAAQPGPRAAAWLVPLAPLRSQSSTEVRQSTLSHMDHKLIICRCIAMMPAL